LRASKVTYFDSLGLLGDAELEKLMLLELKTMKAIIAEITRKRIPRIPKKT